MSATANEQVNPSRENCVKSHTDRVYAKPLFHLVLAGVILALDLSTKWWARNNHSLPNGEPDPALTTQVVGEWLQVRLSFNENAAFGMEFQKILPFLDATTFYSVVYLTLLVLLMRLYFSPVSREDPWGRLGIALIVAGGLGNVVDRLLCDKVTDFIDVEFFNLDFGLGPLGHMRMERWPTFNLADVWIVVGGVLLFALPLLRRRRPLKASSPEKLCGTGAPSSVQ